MNDLKGLIKPGLVVIIKDRCDDIPHIVIDCMDGIQLMCIYDSETYIPLEDFDNNLKYIGTYYNVEHINAICKAQKCNCSVEDNLQILWKREEVKVTLAQIAEQFNTTVDKLKIIDGN